MFECLKWIYLYDLINFVGIKNIQSDMCPFNPAQYICSTPYNFKWVLKTIRWKKTEILLTGNELGCGAFILK